MTLKRCNAILIGFLLFALLLAPSQAASAQTGATGGIFGDYEVQPGGQIEVPVEIRDVTDLYAFDIQISYDPAVVQVEDADPNQEGIQPALGTFLDAGLTLFNGVDSENGLIRFVMTQANPSEAKSGSGVVLVLYLTGMQAGECDLEVTALELSTRMGEAIAVEPVNGRVLVTADAVANNAGSIPVQDPAEMVQIATVIPTPQPTATGDVPQAADEELAGSDAAGQPSEDVSSQTETSAPPADGQGAGFSLVEHWWIVLIVVGLVIGFAIFLGVTRR